MEEATPVVAEDAALEQPQTNSIPEPIVSDVPAYAHSVVGSSTSPPAPEAKSASSVDRTPRGDREAEDSPLLAAGA